MSSNLYTPTTEEVRTDYIMAYTERQSSQLLAGLAFDRWHQAELRRAKAEALGIADNEKPPTSHATYPTKAILEGESRRRAVFQYAEGIARGRTVTAEQGAEPFAYTDEDLGKAARGVADAVFGEGEPGVSSLEYMAAAAALEAVGMHKVG